ncbi:PACE efflux transporter [Shewanella frigidimarina]|uniref:Transmembrane pair domain protein n=1 Tax=Shewanella frigidimarina (strain NCIMB 400) TaxID=318167 RepID=Q082Y9_SHEFN|nr:PACE efflux transporter [Shewanella frigidimarina]ABI71676.1 transmembrane pair domain protein [Shewanella frigidimarina NCIMB 400]|tara:strand:+ start:1190 stop:1615 length:426 start_codon:yes stop_codon:yes gene_type:complete
MQRRERVFHAVSFEVIALAFIVPVSAMLVEKNSTDMLIVSICLSLFAVFWNYVYNILFDKLNGSDRVERKIGIRVVHALGFEGGMLFFTIPLVSWYLSLSLIDTLILEAGVLGFILVYTAVFNWLYDVYQPYQKWFANLAH